MFLVFFLVGFKKKLGVLLGLFFFTTTLVLPKHSRIRKHVMKITAPELEPEPYYKKHSSGAMLTKTQSSGAGAISFLQELRSPGMRG